MKIPKEVLSAIPSSSNIGRTVFVVNDSGHDFSAAEQYGTLVYVTKGLINRFDVNHMLRCTKAAMENCKEEDYILVSSLTILNIIITSFFASRHGRLNLLLFDAVRQRYVARTVIMQ